MRRSRRREAALAAAERHVGRDARRRPGPHAGRFVRSDRQPLAALPDARAAASGRAAVRISRAARSASAISCRTCSRCCTRGPTSAARTCCAPRRGSSSRATCSTGGIRRAAAARGRAAPTICSGCRTPSPATSSQTGDESVLDEVVPFLEAPPLEPDQARDLHAAARVAGVGVALRALRPRHRARDEVRRARTAAHRLRRLERRHESRRPRGPRRERVARLVPRHRAERLRADLRAPRAQRPRPALSRRGALARPACSSWRGTATGIAAPTSTTARRSGRCRTRSASSIR